MKVSEGRGGGGGEVEGEEELLNNILFEEELQFDIDDADDQEEIGGINR